MPTRRRSLRVVNPDATPEEVAALVAVFAALGIGRRRAADASYAGVVAAPHRARAAGAPRQPAPGGLALQRPDPAEPVAAAAAEAVGSPP